VDVWSLGISVIEMAELRPPKYQLHPMRVIFTISRDPPPCLHDRDRWSAALHDFVAQCLQKVRGLHGQRIRLHRLSAPFLSVRPSACLSVFLFTRLYVCSPARASDTGQLSTSACRPNGPGCWVFGSGFRV
jgi:serine/threonine protein kinase